MKKVKSINVKEHKKLWKVIEDNFKDWDTKHPKDSQKSSVK